ncbi:MAG TPA: hypothetical protein VK750_01580 [Cytophagaceae bacterium]|jgi:hypothetical protein|nr:hypothetical protein [Cytophagaceae bacterium]
MNTYEKIIAVLIMLLVSVGLIFYLHEIKVSVDKNRVAIEKLNLKDSVNTAVYQLKDTLAKQSQYLQQTKTVRFKKETKILKHEMDTLHFDPSLLPNY